jgi:hypothetical protein
MRSVVVVTIAVLGGCAVDGTDPVDDEGIVESDLSCGPGAWCSESSPVTGTLHGVWEASTGDVFAVGDAGVILQRTGGVWTQLASGTTQSLRGVFGTSATNVWAVGLGGTVLHYNGTSWSAVAATSSEVDAVWCSSATDIWMTGPGMVWHSANSGTSWTSYGMSGSLYAISGTSASDVWVTGENSYLRHWTGSSWTTVNPGAGTSTFFSILAITSTNVWAANFTPSKETMHLSGTKWAAVRTGGGIWNGMWASSASDIWGAGGAKVGHYTGSAWTLTTPLTGGSWWGTTGKPGVEAYIVGANGAIMRYGY